MKKLAALLAFLAFPLMGQETQLEKHPSVVAVRTDVPPVIDGTVNPEEWKNAAVIEDFMQVQPVSGPPSEKTRVNILYDADNLYIGIQCFDSNPAGIIAKQMQKESDTSPDDVIEFVIDSFADKRNGYYFAITAGGDKLDGLDDSIRNEINTD